MAASYAKHVSTRQTPQSEPIPGKNQVANSAGGYSFAVDHWVQLDRWCILGSEGGSYYATEKKLTQENATSLLKCFDENPLRAVNRIVEISVSGRAPKNDPAIFALAMAATHPKAKECALSNYLMDFQGYAVPKVCRTGTHIFQFVEYAQALRGWGRSLRNAVGNWYLQKEPRDLAYQVTKYQQRNGWSHRDLLRLSHPKAKDFTNWICQWITGKIDNEVLESIRRPDWLGEEKLHPIIAFEKAKVATDKKEIVRLVREYDIVRECIPTQFLTEPEVWEALLEKMPLMAMVRNLATMTRVGLLTPFSDATKKVIEELANKERLHKSRLHPVSVLMALKTYAAGHGARGKHTWTPVQQVIDALDGAFYDAFDNVEPTGKRYYLGIDVSSSMWGGSIAGCIDLTPGMGAGAMAMVTARTEKTWYMGAFHTEMVNFAPSPKQRLDDFCSNISRLPWGGTDCAKPMLDALEKKWSVDVFVVYTDNESWAGKIHASQALDMYRQKMGIPAKAICVGMVANEFSILDGNDSGSLNIAGFDSSVPAIIADFARN